MRTHFNGSFSISTRFGEDLIPKNTKYRREKSDKKNAKVADFCLNCTKTDCKGTCAEFRKWHKKVFGVKANEK